MNIFKKLYKREEEEAPQLKAARDIELAAEVLLYRPVDYYSPVSWEKFMEGFDELVKTRLDAVKADEYTTAYLDAEIDQALQLALKELQKQKTSHERTMFLLQRKINGEIDACRRKIEEFEAETAELEKEKKELLARAKTPLF